MEELEEMIFSRVERDCELLKTLQQLKNPEEHEQLKQGVLARYQEEKQRLDGFTAALKDLGWIDAGER